MVDEHAVNTDTTKMIDQVAAENAELRDVVTRLEARLDREVAAREGTSTE
jgi:hypothetical protein